MLCLLLSALSVPVSAGSSENLPVPLTRTIGRNSVCRAEVTIANSDPKPGYYDSLCSRYWYVHYSQPNLTKDHYYDYEITIKKGNGAESGTIVIFSAEYNGYGTDTSAFDCDELGFDPPEHPAELSSFGPDTLTDETTVYYWRYPRPVKKLAGEPVKREIFSNHIKIRLTSETVRDSIIFTREHVHFTDVKRYSVPGTSGRGFTPAAEGTDRFPMFNIRGQRVSFPARSSQIVFITSGLRNRGTVTRRIFHLGG